jgi:hypothetical protein
VLVLVGCVQVTGLRLEVATVEIGVGTRLLDHEHVSTQPQQAVGRRGVEVIERPAEDLTGHSLIISEQEGFIRRTAPWQLDEVPGADEPFPHIYGPLNASAVVDELPLRRTADGFVVPHLTR